MEKTLNLKLTLGNQLLSKDFLLNDNQLIVLSSPSLAEQTFNQLKKEINSDNIHLLPHTETLPYDFFSPSANLKNERMKTLSKLVDDKKIKLVSSVQSLMSPCADKNHLMPINTLTVKDKLNRNKFLHSLASCGYTKTELVSEVGEFSVRGIVIDIFPTGSRFPVRIEIYEDKIETLRFFNPDNQITTKKIISFSTLPPHEYPLDKKGINNFIRNWRNSFDEYEEDSEIFKRVSKGKSEEGAEMYIPLFFNNKTTPVKYLKNFKHVVLDSQVMRASIQYEKFIQERFEEYRFDIQRPLLHPKELFINSKELKKFFQNKSVIILQTRTIQSHKESKKIKKVPVKENISPLHTMPKLNELVVHLFHGIGIYKGLKQISTKDIVHECLEIEYRDSSKVFVPVESMHLVSKYFGPQDVTIDALGSKKWEKKKNNAIKKTFDTAAELLEVQAKRESKKGSKYYIPKEEYEKFSNEFPYIETNDQLKTISQIEQDLCNPKPMDRLVCGEVGFGKTEVAMRAAFITAFNSEQTCVLVPTTLLAQQHFQNFVRRFSKTPIKIEKLSRDISASKRKKILKELEEGHIDIIIGTHSVLQKNINFCNLGLLIIDEEHKFGVRQKEKIKKIKQEINLLYLSATPIPRSLNFALSELKDFSIISTPPNERLSVKTFVYSFNENLIKESIQRELLRGGQVYYLCNDLRLIEDRRQRFQETFTNFKSDIVHGKLKTNEIEEIMIGFQNGDIDILLCSTIIESGLDISNVNTLIVEEADRLGLAQLHQLRGRVGRGNKQAYAYFLKSKNILKRKRADSRLKTLLDSDSLSAGFLIAIKDLELRGAGEILGENQSGIMESIGIDLYMKLLSKATNQIKKGILESHFLERIIEVNLGSSSFIPDSYLPDINQRLLMYNKISIANSTKEIKEIQIEMINRFGLFPQELQNLFYEEEINRAARAKNIRKLNIVKDSVIIKYFNSKKDKTIPTGKNFEETINSIFKELKYMKKVS